jgi:hypothetical protein
MDQNDPSPDYSFLEPGSQKSGFFAAADKQKRILIVAAGGGILLVFLLLLGALIFGGRTDLRQELVTIAQRQEEIVRIAEIGQDQARSQEVLTLSTITKASIASSQNSVVNRASGLGTSLGSSDLRLRENQQTTSELESAEQANRFDEVYLEILRDELLAYRENIERAADQATGNTFEMLDDLWREANLLLDTIENI